MKTLEKGTGPDGPYHQTSTQVSDYKQPTDKTRPVTQGAETRVVTYIRSVEKLLNDNRDKMSLPRLRMLRVRRERIPGHDQVEWYNGGQPFP